MSERRRAIVIGAGTIGRIHIDALRRNNIELASIVNLTPERSLAGAEQFGAERGDPDLATALRHAGADTLHVCTPDTTHFDFTAQALKAGLNVVCEKPLTADAPSAGELYRIAADSGAVHAICFNNRYYTLLQELASLRRGGAFDRIFLVRASVADDTFWLESDWDWRLMPEHGGSTIVTSVTGSHLMDLTSFVIGSRIVSVCADFLTAHDVRKRPLDDGTTEDYRAEGEDVSNILVHFANGAHGVLSLSHVAVGHPYRVRVEIDASKAGASWDGERPNELWIGHRYEPNQVISPDARQATEDGRKYMENPGAFREGFSDTFRLLFRDVYRQSGLEPSEREAPDFPTFRDGYAIQIVHDAALQSARERRWVDVDWTAFDALPA